MGPTWEQLKQKLKNFFDNLKSLAKINPFIFAMMVFNIVYGLTTAIISLAVFSLFIGITGMYSLIFGITKYYALNGHKKMLETEDGEANRKTENVCAIYTSVCATVMSFLYFSFAIVSIFFFEEAPAVYSSWFIYFIAAAAFIKMILSLTDSIRTRRNHSIIIHHLKLMDFANALISLALLQRAILFFVGYESANLVGGIGVIFFSICALLVCLSMFMKYKDRSRAYESTADRPDKRTCEKTGSV